jgi:hypothetical protein
MGELHVDFARKRKEELSAIFVRVATSLRAGLRNACHERSLRLERKLRKLQRQETPARIHTGREREKLDQGAEYVVVHFLLVITCHARPGTCCAGALGPV